MADKKLKHNYEKSVLKKSGLTLTKKKDRNSQRFDELEDLI